LTTSLTVLLSAVLAAEIALALMSSFSRTSTSFASWPGILASRMEICLMVMKGGLPPD